MKEKISFFIEQIRDCLDFFLLEIKTELIKSRFVFEIEATLEDLDNLINNLLSSIEFNGLGTFIDIEFGFFRVFNKYLKN